MRTHTNGTRCSDCVPITRRYRRRPRHAALMLTVGKGHSLNRNISGKMNHSVTICKTDVRILDNFSTDADIRPADDPLSVYLTRERCAAARARRRGDRGKDFLSRFRVTPPRFTAFDAASLATQIGSLPQLITNTCDISPP